MFVNDKILYLQLQKTGCTHIARILTDYVGGANQNKHGRLDQAPEGRLILGSVRNPWDWYVSLWAYGCMGEGAIRTRLTTGRGALALRTLRGAALHPGDWLALPGVLLRQNHRHDTVFWRRVYADPDDRGAFRDWLQAIHDPDVQTRVFEDPRVLPLHEAVGLYSARLVYLYSDPVTWDRDAPTLRDPAGLAAFFAAHSVLDRMIRTETIAADIFAVLQDIGVTDMTRDRLEALGRTNSSKRDAFASYYDTATMDLVARRDSFVIDHFGYAPFSATAQNAGSR